MSEFITRSTVAPQTVPQLLEFAAMLVKSGMVPVRTPEAAAAIILKGRELGLEPMAALNGITVIQGRATVSPQLMLSLIDRSGLCVDRAISTSAQGATCTMQRKGRKPHTATFGPAEAESMGLASKENYRKQPATMYQWRAVAACARVVFPDVLDGIYTAEELGADVAISEEGEVITVEATPAPVQVVQEDKPKKRAQTLKPMKGVDYSRRSTEFLTKDRAHLLHKELAKAGWGHDLHYSQASALTGREIKSLTEISEREGAQLYDIARHRATARERAAQKAASPAPAPVVVQEAKPSSDAETLAEILL